MDFIGHDVARPERVMHVTDDYLGIVKCSIENMTPYHFDLMLKYEHVNWGEI